MKNNQEKNPKSKVIKVGHCPTMGEHISKINPKLDFSPMPFGAAAEALYYLNNGLIDVALIGRKAEKEEFNGYERKLKDGYTLINLQAKQMVPKHLLPSLEVHTYIKPEIAREYFPELKAIHFDKDLSESIERGKIILIDWDDWQDNFFLLIPVEDDYQKVKKYRTPFLYSNDEFLISRDFLDLE